MTDIVNALQTIPLDKVSYYAVRALVGSCLFASCGSFAAAYISTVKWFDDVVIGLGFLVAAAIIYAFAG